MKKKRSIFILTLTLVLTVAILGGCTSAGENGVDATGAPNATVSTGQANRPALPEKLEIDDEGVPQLRVYVTDEDQIQELDIETYLLGVLAGEMKNDWPMEALKAQAILARTFVLKFCTEKESRYDGADISTDIEEAQAYDATGVNERIEQAVAETRGLVLSYQGELPYAWFHAHSGGATAKAKEGLAYEKEEPGYTQVVEGQDSDQAPDDAKAWNAVFDQQEMLKALETVGVRDISQVESAEVGERGESGRAVTLIFNGRSVSAPELRIALGSSKMRSTLLTSLKVENGQIKMSGKGYGHGVGMPQWGAYGLAEQGKTAEDIVTYYFNGVTVEKLW